MRDNFLNSILIAVTFAAILFAAIDDNRPTPQAAMAQASRVLQMEKTVVAAKRLPTDLARTTFAGATLIASAAQ